MADLSDLKSTIDNIRPNFGLEKNGEKSKNSTKEANQLAENEKISNSDNSQNLSEKEQSPSSPNPFSYTGSGKQIINKSKKKISAKNLIKFAPILVFLIIIVVIAAVSIGATSLLPGQIDENSQEAFDVQYPALLKAYLTVTEKTLATGSVPSPFVDRLADAGMEVGYFDKNNNFIAGLRPNSENSVALASKTSDSKEEKDNSLVVKFKDNIINATEFAKTIETNAEAFSAFENATFGRALAHYDDNATSFYSTIKASRNVFQNYEATADIKKDTENFHKIFTELFKEKAIKNTSTSTPYEDKDINKAEIERTINELSIKENKQETISYLTEIYKAAIDNSDPSGERTAANMAALINNAMNANETYYSMHYYLTLEEAISKIKSGNSATSPINPILNFLTETTTSKVADLKNNGDLIEVTGSAVQSPGLSSVLTKNYPSDLASEVANYSSDRFTKLAEKVASSSNADNSRKKTPISTTNSQASGWLKDFSYSYKQKIILGNAAREPIKKLLALIAPSISQSLLFENTADRLSGITAGEFFNKGGAALGQHIATFAQGGTTGDENAIIAYDTYSEKVIAMENAADRARRSPLDITSKNTFLGSVFANLNNNIISSDSLFSTFSTLSNLTGNSFLSILPGAFAANNEGNKKTYQTSFSDSCPALDNIGSKGDIYCNPTITFDINTIETALASAEFEEFLDKNLIAINSSEVTTPKSVKLAAQTTVDIPSADDSTLKDMLDYNNARSSQFGVKDLGVYQAAKENTTVSYSESPEENDPEDEWDQDARDKSSGKTFRNSSSNSKWSQYKYAQAYMTYERVLKQMEYFSSDNKNEASLSEHFTPGTGYSPVSNYLAVVAEDIEDDSDAEYLARISGMTTDDAETIIALYSYGSYLASLDYSRYCLPGEENCKDLPEEKILQTPETTLTTTANFASENSSYYKKQEAYVTA